jgi:isoquinoline 1-oxidoreductase subunit beta
MNRRHFIVNSSKAAGGLALSFNFPMMAKLSAQTQGAAANEVTAWVVVKPDDSIVVRIARSEMGQGTLTGLAQMVVDDLDGNWAKVSTEYPTPGENLARARIWGDFGTGGSRGIRMSQDYVRRGGAAARQMLNAMHRTA